MEKIRQLKRTGERNQEDYEYLRTLLNKNDYVPQRQEWEGIIDNNHLIRDDVTNEQIKDAFKNNNLMTIMTMVFGRFKKSKSAKKISKSVKKISKSAKKIVKKSKSSKKIAKSSKKIVKKSKSSKKIVKKSNK
jgi:hypothetical protein